MVTLNLKPQGLFKNILLSPVTATHCHLLALLVYLQASPSKILTTTKAVYGGKEQQENIY